MHAWGDPPFYDVAYLDRECESIKLNQMDRSELMPSEPKEDTMVPSLARFTITKALDETFLLHIEDDSGTTLELEATYEQLDLISETIEEAFEMEAHDAEALDDDVEPDNDD